MDVHCRDVDFKFSEVVGWKWIVDTVVYHTQSLRPKGQSVNPPWREKTKLRESDLIGIVLVVIDSVCYGFVVPWE